MRPMTFEDFWSHFPNGELAGNGNEIKFALADVLHRLASTENGRGDLIETARILAGLNPPSDVVGIARRLPEGKAPEAIAAAFYYWLHIEKWDTNWPSFVDEAAFGKGKTFEEVFGHPVWNKDRTGKDPNGNTYLPVRVVKELGLRRELIESLVLRYQHDNPNAPDSELIQFLKDKAEEHKEYKLELETLGKTKERVKTRIKAAQVPLDEGRYDDVIKILRSAEETQRLGSALIEVRLVADIRAACAGAALLKGDVDLAFVEFTAAAECMEPLDVLEAAFLRKNYSAHLRDQGERFGGTGLSKAIEFLERNLQTYTREKHPKDRAATQHELAGTLQLMSKQLGGVDKLNALTRAIDMCEAALEIRTRTVMPFEWIATQNSMANAMERIGSLISGIEGVKALEQAVEIYNVTLKVCTRSKMPGDWAMTKHNLAVTLKIWAIRIGGQKGLKALRRSISTFEDVLEVYNYREAPKDWALTQTNLANVLDSLGECIGGLEGMKALERAAQAHRAALKIYDRIEMPMEWAMTKHNLAGTLATIGERADDAESGLPALDRAVEAYEEALEVFTFTDMPIQWATTQNDLGTAFQKIGERSAGTDGLEALQRAISIHKNLLESRTRTEDPTDWSMSQNNLATALRIFGERAHGAEGLSALNCAITAYEAALEVRTCVGMPAQWARTTTFLSLTRLILGLQTADRDLVQLGIDAMDEAKEIFRTLVPQEHVDYMFEIRKLGVDFIRSSQH